MDTKITSNSEESDDSVVGEHSPFVKHGSRKRSVYVNRKVKGCMYFSCIADSP